MIHRDETDREKRIGDLDEINTLDLDMIIKAEIQNVRVIREDLIGPMIKEEDE